MMMYLVQDTAMIPADRGTVAAGSRPPVTLSAAH
jgi:hypothetical protein